MGLTINPYERYRYDAYSASREVETEIPQEIIDEAVDQLPSDDATNLMDLFSGVKYVKSDLAHIIPQGDKELIDKYLAVVVTLGKLMFLSQQVDGERAIEIHEEIQTIRKMVLTLADNYGTRDKTIKALEVISTASTVVTSAASVGALVALCVASGGTVAVISGLIGAVAGVSSGTTGLTEALLKQKNEQTTGEMVGHQTRESLRQAELEDLQKRMRDSANNSTKAQDPFIKALEQYRLTSKMVRA